MAVANQLPAGITGLLYRRYRRSNQLAQFTRQVLNFRRQAGQQIFRGAAGSFFFGH
jgi:hypothetical protein